MLFIEDIMTKDVVAVSPDTPLIKAANVLSKHGFDGVPVVDKRKKLVGILTEYDLISKDSAVHLPTFQIILQKLKVHGKDRSKFQDEFKEISSLRVEDVMNNDPLALSEGTTFEETFSTFQQHHKVNPIPVIDKENKVVGVVSRYDLLKPLHLLQ